MDLQEMLEQTKEAGYPIQDARAKVCQDIVLEAIAKSSLSIDAFIQKINCLPDMSIERIGKIIELNQQDYRGKSAKILITDQVGASIRRKYLVKR